MSTPEPAKHEDSSDEPSGLFDEHHFPRWSLLLAWAVVQTFAVAAVMMLWLVLAASVNGPKGHYLGEFDDGLVEKITGALVELEYWVLLGMVCGPMLLAQAVLLWPVRRPAPPLAKGWDLRLSIGLGALLAGVLIVAMLFVPVAVFQIVKPHVEPPPILTASTMLWALFVAWLVATPFVVAFGRRQLRETFLARLSARLLLGTGIEALAILPLDIMVRRKTDCYCSTGTFFHYSVLIALAFTLFGPWALLRLLTKRRKRWYAGRCDACGYDMRGTPRADRCPECGAGWKGAGDVRVKT